MKKTFISASEKETENFSYEFSKLLKKGDFVAFFGDLGAGKTAFVRGAVKALCPNAAVCSPTYAIMNQYLGDGVSVCHFDLYRIKSEDDLYSIGFDDYLDGENIIFTEWSENVEEFLPKERYSITISKIGESERLIDIDYPE